jgi:thiol-disulfide isomerase/thioredoxin
MLLNEVLKFMGMDTEFEADTEIEELLNRKARELVKSREEKPSVRCCIGIGGFRSVRSYDEFMNVVGRCRVAFILVTTTFCPYCQMFKPVFAKVADEFRDMAVFLEANADYVPEVAEAFEVYSTPTTVVLVDGRPVDAVVGYVPYSQFRRYVNEVLRYAKCVAS